MGRVIERLGTTVNATGLISHDERPASFARADALAGHRVDRRRRYAIIDGKLCMVCAWTAPCSGCFESGYDFQNSNDRGAGCKECGYHGRSRQSYWVPYLREAGIKTTEGTDG